jgi:hypothetical protein
MTDTIPATISITGLLLRYRFAGCHSPTLLVRATALVRQRL